MTARLLAERDARHASERRVAIASAQIRSRLEEATTLTQSLSQLMLDDGAKGVTNGQFRQNASRWLSPAGLPAAAWAEEVQAANRAAYERRIGRSIVAPDDRRQAAPRAFSYLPTTLVSGFPPMSSRGIDLRRELGIAAALNRAIRPGGVGATPIAARKDGTRGLFLVAPAPDVIDGVLRPGAVVVFLSEATLRAAASNPAGLQFPSADPSLEDGAGGATVREEFMVAGQQFAVVMPKESVSGSGAVLPWIILASGFLLAALGGALGVVAARRAKAQRDFDRDLAESRARIVRTGDEARRRFERDLHDGAQQRLVSLGLELRTAEASVASELGDLRNAFSRLGTGLTDVLDDLRELSRGLHPTVLSEGGLSPALRSLARRSAVPVDVRIDTGRFEEPVEVTAYYVASEALTNTAKHAQASRAQVTVSYRDGWLELIVSDDGRGGADASGGSGLVGLVDRVEATGGTIHIDSPPEVGTTLRVKLPINSAQ